MSLTIFYSWQDKREKQYNRFFIQDCIKEAVKQIKKELKDEAPEIYFDRGGVEGIPGMPNIPTSIQGKIKESDIFIGDVTYVSYVDTTMLNGDRSLWDRITAKNKYVQEGQSNANVSEELGIAKGDHRGDSRIITVMNTVYGKPDLLNFDSKQSRYPLTYNYSTANKGDKKKEKEALVMGLKERMLVIIRTEQERQKEYFRPFYNWQIWQRIGQLPFSFVRTAYVDELYTELENHISSSQSVFRLCGLSGIGKTRLLFEYFAQKEDRFVHQSGRLLYVDLTGQEDVSVKEAVRNLVLKEENKILVVDNCPLEFHTELSKMVTAQQSKLNLLTVSTDPEEKSSSFGPSSQTKMFVLENEKCKDTVQEILDRNFTEFEEQEKILLKDFSSGISFVAALMAENRERGKHQPGTLTEQGVIRKLLGPFYDDPLQLAVIQACCLFSKFGYYEDLSYQTEAIAQSPELCNLDQPGDDPADGMDLRKRRFKETCEKLYERKLLEKKGRTFSFRPSPLAVRMAEEWWKSCGVAKFQKILPVLAEAKLVEAFCEQFRYLKHIVHAQAIVKDLCQDGGVFRSAEVINTQVGSRLFRSFVYVNPVACTEALFAAFGEMNATEATQINEGRRNLVWALEQLCFRRETFEQSTKVLAVFASGENENISNNATGQFRQLFHIRLPGTAASLVDRLEIIRWCLAKSPELESLGITALSSALITSHFSRSGGAEDQGDLQPLVDYSPNGKEVYDYWKDVINLLKQYAVKDGTHKQRAIDILMNNFYGMCTQGAGKLILDVVDELFIGGVLDKLELRSQVQSAIESHRVFNNEIEDRLQVLFESLQPTSFEERFKILVVSPSSDEYRNEEESLGTALQRKIESLAKEYIDNGLDQTFALDLLVTGELREGYKFGKAVVEQLNENKKWPFLERLINHLVHFEEKKRNGGFALGFIDNLNNYELTLQAFHLTLENKHMQYISFLIARSAKLPLNELRKLLDIVKNGDISVEQFMNFDYGWGLRHLKSDEVKFYFDEIASTNDVGKVIRLMILAHWVYNDEELWKQFHAYIKQLIISDSKVVLDITTNTMDYFNWAHLVLKLIKDEEPTDEEFARLMMTIVLEQLNDERGYYRKQNELYRISDVICEKHFHLVWQAVATAFKEIADFGFYYHLKDLMGSNTVFSNSIPGLLFKRADKHLDYIIDWVKQNPGEGWWIANMIPLYNGEPGVATEWHPHAKIMIDLLGNDDKFLGELSARMGSYSWTGSVVPKLESDLALYRSLLDHPIEKVQEWANSHIEDLSRRITWEKNRDEDGVW